jgi:hypothetical protein
MGLLERSQVLTLHILDQRFDERALPRCAADDRGDGHQTGPSRCPPATLTGDQIVMTLVVSGDHHRLQNADLFDR